MSVVVASCGGSGDGGGDNGGSTPAAANQPPASASQDVGGFIAYLKGLVPTRQDTVEPLDVTAFVAPVSDGIEPDPSV